MSRFQGNGTEGRVRGVLIGEDLDRPESSVKFLKPLMGMSHQWPTLTQTPHTFLTMSKSQRGCDPARTAAVKYSGDQTQEWNMQTAELFKKGVVCAIHRPIRSKILHFPQFVTRLSEADYQIVKLSYVIRKSYSRNVSVMNQLNRKKNFPRFNHLSIY